MLNPEHKECNQYILGAAGVTNFLAIVTSPGSFSRLPLVKGEYASMMILCDWQ